MKAKNLGRNLKRTLSTIGKGYSYGRGYRVNHRRRLDNDEVRYACTHGVMFVVDGSYMYIRQQ